MTARDTVRTTRLRRWVRAGFFVAAVIGAALAVLAWRPVTVLNGVTWARLWVAGVRDGSAQSGPYPIVPPADPAEPACHPRELRSYRGVRLPVARAA